jgi:hypothetical protein
VDMEGTEAAEAHCCRVVVARAHKCDGALFR